MPVEEPVFSGDIKKGRFLILSRSQQPGSADFWNYSRLKNLT
jgi:hypothetical protein